LTEDEIWTRLNEIFREAFEDDELQLNPETTANDIEDWDSLSNIEILVTIEKDFGIRFNTGEVAGLKNVGEMVALITERSRSAR
jgi:acyl carrier protein